VIADPGAGKTTRVPPALAADGPLILLQPRRVAARAIAQRVAAEQHWTLGREVGWQVRFERRFGPETRLLVATEGILTARFQQDPLLSDFKTVVLDEFHERSIHGDLAITFAKQAWRARSDLRLVVMSATLDAEAVSSFLDGSPVIRVPGRVHPLQVSYVPGGRVVEAATDLLTRTAGDLLCFLPGASEIRRTIADLQPNVAPDVDLIPLYGSLDAAEQDRALAEAPAGRRRIVVATNIAETSVTVPCVTGVVDSGLHKVARYDDARGIDSLELERITRDSADQRAGRAGRLRPGVVVRLWDERDRLRPHRDAEIQRVDLAGPVLDVVAWGGNPHELDWFEPPRPQALDAALTLLERLGAVRSGRLTEVGDRMRHLPLHPRLARMFLAAGGARPIVRACALLTERQSAPPRTASTSSDLLSAVDDWNRVPPHVDRIAREIERMATDPGRSLPDEEFRRAVLAGYPDRVAQRRETGSPRMKLASGTGAILGTQSGVREGEFLVAVDVVASTRTDSPDALIRMASRVEREWLEPNAIDVVHKFDSNAAIVRASEVERYDALTLAERAVLPDPEIAGRILAERWLARGPMPSDARLLARLEFAGIAIDLPVAIRAASHGLRALADVRLERALPADAVRRLNREAPEVLQVPSGRSVPLTYQADGSVKASVKLQELFGLGETPRIGPRRQPVTFALLAPNGRPVQLTQDLRSFWERTYPDIRKELRGRYPKHPWPEDPWKATPTARTTRQGRK
jgi:ATP-dependent helicase HrpB